MITHDKQEDKSLATEILLALDELQEQVDLAGGLPLYIKSQMDKLRHS